LNTETLESTSTPLKLGW